MARGSSLVSSRTAENSAGDQSAYARLPSLASPAVFQAEAFARSCHLDLGWSFDDPEPFPSSPRYGLSFGLESSFPGNFPRPLYLSRHWPSALSPGSLCGPVEVPGPSGRRLTGRESGPLCLMPHWIAVARLNGDLFLSIALAHGGCPLSTASFPTKRFEAALKEPQHLSQPRAASAWVALTSRTQDFRREHRVCVRVLDFRSRKA